MKNKKRAGGVAISIRDNELFSKEWQCQLSLPTQSPPYIDTEGNIRPCSIRLEDSRAYGDDRLKYRCRAASTKVGGCGMRYTVMIEGKETYLFEEDGRWFVEEKDAS